MRTNWIRGMGVAGLAIAGCFSDSSAPVGAEGMDSGPSLPDATADDASGVEDATAGLVLSTEAHWNQNEADWRFFLGQGIVFGVRHDIASVARTGIFWAKLAFPLAIAVGAMLTIGRIGRPGARLGYSWMIVALPFMAVWIAGWMLLD